LLEEFDGFFGLLVDSETVFVVQTEVVVGFGDLVLPVALGNRVLKPSDGYTVFLVEALAED
jgi:hypothetical protein